MLATVDSGLVERTKPFLEPEITEIYNLFESYKKYASPITRIPARHLYKRLDSCLREVAKQKSLYGQCLLQKLLIMDSLDADRKNFDELAKGYLLWFPTMSPNDKDFQKLKEARDILEKMIGKT